MRNKLFKLKGTSKFVIFGLLSIVQVINIIIRIKIHMFSVIDIGLLAVFIFLYAYYYRKWQKINFFLFEGESIEDINDDLYNDEDEDTEEEDYDF